MSAWNEIGRMFPPDFVNRIGWIFVHSIWQITLIALAVATLGRMLHRRSAAVRYATYLAMLAVAAAAPLITYGLTSGANVVAARPVEPIPTAGPMQVETAIPMSIVEGAPSAIQPIAPQQAADAMPENEPASTEAKQSSLFQRLRNAFTDLLEPWFGTIVVFWLVGIITFSIRPLIGWATMQRLRKQGTSPCSKSIGQLAKRVANAVHVNHRVSVLESTLAQVPMVIGYFRPVVLIPVSVATNLSMPQIESILAHELAHVRRHDFVVNALQTVVETVLFYHPGIWWISYRIRVERENCCDDIAVAATGDRLEYGRALLAIEEIRVTAPTLALGANSSALPHRIRRLFSTDATISRYTLLPVYLAGAAVLLVGLSWSFLQAADNNDWGPESLDGLVCRIAPVDPKMSEDEIRLDSPVTEFKKPEDVTFAVEIKNRSKKAVTLIGVHYDDSSGVSGKANSNHFAPHLFEFTFRRLASGEEHQKFKQPSPALPRTERKFTASSQAMVFGRASTHELQPGKSLKLLLRPTEFERAMEYELFAGNFTASVRYQTPGSEVRGMIRKFFPDKKQPESTPHEVASNQTMFSVAEDPKHPIPNLIWGPEKDGLQAALEIRTSNGRADGNAATAPGVRLGSGLHAVLHVKNVGNKEITFVSETGRQGDTVHVTNAKGKEFDVPNVWYSGWPIDVRWKLKPGDIAKLRVLTPSLGGIDLPGEYKVHFTIRFNSRQKKDLDGNVIHPAAGDWQSELDTGKTPLILRRDPLIISKQGEIRGRLVDDATGEPIRGAMIACGALRTDTHKGGGDRCTTDSDGNYRLQPPGPGIYTVWMKKHPRSQRATAAADDGLLVKAGEVTQSNLRSLAGRHLHGKVLNVDGNPVEHLTVRCHSAARPLHGSTQSVRTKKDGSFAFFVPPGRAYVYTSNKIDGGNKEAKYAGADATIDVSNNGHPDAFTLRLAQSTEPIGSMKWVKETTPGTKVLSQKLADDVTGTVVDPNGDPVENVEVLIHGAPASRTDGSGNFHVKSSRASQFLMYAFKSGYRIWMGKPTSGDVLKIVLEPKAPLPDEHSQAAPPKAYEIRKVGNVYMPVVDPVTQRSQSDNVLVSLVKRGSIKFGGTDPRMELLVLKDGTAIVPTQTRARPNSEVSLKLSRGEIDRLIEQIFDECEAESITGPWFNGKFNSWDGSQDILVLRDGKQRDVTLTCEYGWRSDIANRQQQIVQFTKLTNLLYDLRNVICAGGVTAIENGLPTANDGLRSYLPNAIPLTTDDFRFGEVRETGERRLTYIRQREAKSESGDQDGSQFEKVRVEVLASTEGTRVGDVTVNGERHRPSSVFPLHGVDLDSFPQTTNRKELSDLFASDSENAGKFILRDNAVRLTMAGQVYCYYRSDLRKFYLSRSVNGEITYFGPIAGSPIDVLNLRPYLLNVGIPNDSSRHEIANQANAIMTFGDMLWSHDAECLMTGASVLTEILASDYAINNVQARSSDALNAEMMLNNAIRILKSDKKRNMLQPEAITELQTAVSNMESAFEQAMPVLPDDKYMSQPQQAMPDDQSIAWGEVVDGLRFGIDTDHVRMQSSVRPETRTLFIQNKSEQPIRFRLDYEPENSLLVRVSSNDGKNVISTRADSLILDSFRRPSPTPVVLLPNEKLSLCNFRLIWSAPATPTKTHPRRASTLTQRIEAEPGDYSLVVETPINRTRNIRCKGEWHGTLRTSPISVSLVSAK